MKHTFGKTAFTLVELIVVITILAILGTIGFISLQGYSVNARDSVRIADTKTFIKALNIFQTKEGQVPLPDDTTTITGSGVVFSYQGTLSGSVITALKQGAVPLDPTLNEPYLYATNDTQTKFQLLSYMEKNTSVAGLSSFRAQAVDSYSDYFLRVVGDKVGILLNINNSTLTGGSLELQSVTQNMKLVTGSKSQNQILIHKNIFDYLNSGGEKTTCKDILDSSKTQPSSGYFNVSTEHEGVFEVYCDMETDGGGWTVMASDAGNIDALNLDLLSSTPSNTQAGLLMNFADTPIVELGDKLRVVDINDAENFAQYDISSMKMGKNFSFNQMEYGYLFDRNIGFAGGETSPHKCNFSIIRIGIMGCGQSLDVDFPADGYSLGGRKGYVSTNNGTTNYSWQFMNGSSNLFRLGWNHPQSGYEGYYNERVPSYVMFR